MLWYGRILNCTVSKDFRFLENPIGLSIIYIYWGYDLFTISFPTFVTFVRTIDIIGKCIYDTYFNHYIWRPRIWQFSHIKPFGATCHVWYILHFLANFYPLWVSVTYSLKSMHHIYFVQWPCNSYVVRSNMCINEIHHRHTYVYTYSFDLKAFA